MQTNKSLKVAVVGSGGIGEVHVQAFQSLPEQFELVAICDVDEAKARWLAEKYAIGQVFTDLEQVCGRADLDVIDLCTPPGLHFSQVLAGLAAGKHIICEKPLVSSLREVDELIKAADQAGKQVMPIFQLRFGHGLQKLKLLVDSGLAGKHYLATVETCWLRGPEYYAVPWRGKWQTALGGTLVNQAIHAHDMLTYILGPVKSVFARTATRVSPVEVEDCASASLEMADGSLVSLSTTLGSTEQITRHRFCFSGFTAESNTLPYNNSTDPWRFTAGTPEQTTALAEVLAGFTALPEGHTGQFYRFYKALQTNQAPPVTLQDARASLELITALYFSAVEGLPVNLPIDEAHPYYNGWLP
jgi:predicted dehydrogenase